MQLLPSPFLIFGQGKGIKALSPLLGQRIDAWPSNWGGKELGRGEGKKQKSLINFVFSFESCALSVAIGTQKSYLKGNATHIAIIFGH